MGGRSKYPVKLRERANKPEALSVQLARPMTRSSRKSSDRAHTFREGRWSPQGPTAVLNKRARGAILRRLKDGTWQPAFTLHRFNRAPGNPSPRSA
jgi:hypothetical protein